MIYLFVYEFDPSILRTSRLRSLNALEKAVQNFPGWCQCLGNTWLIATNEDISVVNGKISKHLKDNDQWLLISVGTEYQGWLPKEMWDWIEDTKEYS